MEHKPQWSEALHQVRAYHARTKHHLERYAAGPATLDWTQQPDPFRTFEGAKHIPLAFGADKLATAFSDLYVPKSTAPAELSADNLGVLLELCFALSAWKAFGDDRWALRCNPSSGNLHPTEAYLVTTGVSGMADGVYHYASYDHALEMRCRFRQQAPGKALLIGLTSAQWREAWKYGERAFRYCQLDTGHAIAAVRYAAAAMGWTTKLVHRVSDDELDTLLGIARQDDFDGVEPEQVETLLAVGPAADQSRQTAPTELVAWAGEGDWYGHATRLDPRHRYEWPIIDEVSRATRKPTTDEPVWTPEEPATANPPHCETGAAVLIRQRRSAQAFDGATAIMAPAFFRMLDMTLPRPHVAPWDTLHWQPTIHLALFVHRVEGLRPGLYALPRRQGVESDFRNAMREQFEWQRVQECPAHIPLYRLLAANSRRAAATLSCHQAIAADSAFSLAMIGEFDTALALGPWGYRRLFWEAGVLGQVLYLEAEAAGVRGTGIGCYFDDAVHETLGIQDTRFQSMYHFTVGAPISDVRLQTLPPYAHLKGR